ncbi:DUF6636 domain-containing protein [Deinococcus altitudinis]|uniref:DUF6636 domain-containing protein n=1 Tax=Deinococcus altitudinis TaxID=468914 RepID=UPI0038927FE7
MKARLLPLALLLLSAPVSAQGTVTGFQLPSGRLACQYDDASGPPTLRCDVLEPTFKKAPRPTECPLEWGDALGLGAAGKPFLVCHGDTVLDPSTPVLRYGPSWRKGKFTCRASTAGVRCSNAAGHGFELARARYRLF